MIRKICSMVVLASSTCFAEDTNGTDTDVAKVEMVAEKKEAAPKPATEAPPVKKEVPKKPEVAAEKVVAEKKEKPAKPVITASMDKQAPLTALYLMSTAAGHYKDYLGMNKANAYIEGKNAHFSVSSNYHNGVTVNCNIKDNYLGLSFTAAEKSRLKPGIYKHAERFPRNELDRPGLALSGYHRECEVLGGEFEILELQYNDREQVEKFAANFIQKCTLTGLPLFGSIRYNSAVPVEARFHELLEQKPSTIMYLSKHDPAKNATSQPILITEEGSTFKFSPLPYGGEGIEIFIDDQGLGQWTMDFATPVETSFEIGTYENAGKYPFQSSVSPGVDIVTPDGYFTRAQSGFKVLNIIKAKSGEIESLALNFTAHNENGEVLEGAIRFNSNVPVDLEKPY